MVNSRPAPEASDKVFNGYKDVTSAPGLDILVESLTQGQATLKP